jgi:hypothetical protein
MPGALMPLCAPSTPPFHDHRLQLVVFRRGHPQLDPPVVEQEPVAQLC